MAINSLDRVEIRSISRSNLVVQIDDFKPHNIYGLDYSLRFLRDSVYGNQAGIYHEALVRGYDRTALKLQPLVDAEATRSIMDMWGIPDAYGARKFFMDQMRTANKTVAHLLDATVPGWKQNYSLMHELTSPAENPSWALEWMATAKNMGEEQLAFEAQRQSVLAIAAGSINARTEGDRVGTTRAKFQKAILGMYHRPIATQPYVLMTEHDNETGRVTKVGDYEVSSSDSTHLRRREYQVRSVDGVGPVIVGDRQKGDPEMVLKMMAKAKNRMIRGKSAYLQPEDATDAFGMKLVVVEPGKDGYESRMEQLQDKVVERLAGDSSISIKHFQPDNGKNIGRGTSKHHGFLRLQVHMEDVSTPYEVIIENAAQMRNNEVMYGAPSLEVWEEFQYQAFQEETGVDLRGRLPDGTAHKMYRFRRYLALLPTLFPSAIYGDRVIDHALDNLYQLGDRLRTHDRLPNFDMKKFDF